MITEDYVSFEIAKLLKEKGFCENTEHEIWYVIKQFSTGCHWNSCTYKVGDITREYNDDCCIPMPTLQMAMKWLRNKGIYIQIRRSINTYLYGAIMLKDGSDTYATIPSELETYEEAVEAALKYTLKNLI